MGRLIDASNLNFEGQNYNKSQMKAILDFIDAQPIAYDVDAVVAELEDKKGTYFDGLKCEGTMMRINDAIDIVKRGGAE